MFEVELLHPFLKIKETLTRIGIVGNSDPNTGKSPITQSCHILHKRDKNNKSRYYIVHFKEMFILDGKAANLSQDDIGRRNRIIQLLSDWGLIKMISKFTIDDPIAAMNQIRVVKYADKHKFTFRSKYTLGVKK